MQRSIPGKGLWSFSNGPDNFSVVPPEDVAELAQSAGVSIYMISTREAQLEPVSTAVFERMTAATGGKAYFSKSWRDEKRAFASIQDDLAHLYYLTLLPAGQYDVAAEYHGKAGRQQTEEIPRAHPQRISPTTQPLHRRRGIGIGVGIGRDSLLRIQPQAWASALRRQTNLSCCVRLEEVGA